MFFCRPLPGLCAHNAACQVDGTNYKGLGILQPLEVSSEGVRVVYTNGTKCHNAQFQRSTVIDFRCDRDAVEPQLHYVTEHDNCSYVFYMDTALACPPQQAQCTYTDPATQTLYDLSPLTKASENWIGVSSLSDDDGGGEDEEYAYFINVCRDLVPDSTLPAECQGSPVCQAAAAGGVAHPLGRVSNFSWSTTDNGNVAITYSGGPTCSDGAVARVLDDLSDLSGVCLRRFHMGVKAFVEMTFLQSEPTARDPMHISVAHVAMCPITSWHLVLCA